MCIVNMQFYKPRFLTYKALTSVLDTSDISNISVVIITATMHLCVSVCLPWSSQMAANLEPGVFSEVSAFWKAVVSCHKCLLVGERWVSVILG